MPKMSQAHNRVHQVFLGLKKPFDPTDIYTSMCKLLKLTDEAIDRGLGKLFRDGKLKAPEARAKPSRHGAASRRPEGDDQF